MSEQENPFLDTRIKCGTCQSPIVARLVIQYIQSSLYLSFTFAFCLSFTLLTVTNDVYLHYFNTGEAMQTSVEPYKGAMFFAGLISFLSWTKIKRKRIHEIKESLGNKNG